MKNNTDRHNNVKENIAEVNVSELKKKYITPGIGNELMLVDDISRLNLTGYPRHMGCLFIALCLSGQGEYSVDTTQHRVGPNDVIIISEGQVVDICKVSDDFSGLAFIMSSDFYREMIQNIHDLSSLYIFSRTYPVYRVDDHDADTLCYYFNLIKNKAEDTLHHYRKEVVCTLLTAMIYDLSNTIFKLQNLDNKRHTRREAIFTTFIEELKQNFRTERRVAWYAQRLRITAKYLSEAVKLVSQRSPGEWIDNYVTLEIRVLLKNTTLSLKEIADQMNFPNQSYFGKYFKEHVGMSPSEYRRS